MDFNIIQQTIKLFEASQISYLCVEDGNQKITLEKPTAPGVPAPLAPSTPAPSVAPSAPAEEEGLYTVKAPVVGVFYAAKAPGDAPFVTPGQRVEKGDILCLVEAMKNISEIKSPVSGTIRSVLVTNEAFIQFDQPLFLFEDVPC